jgi:hypothetical protein
MHTAAMHECTRRNTTAVWHNIVNALQKLHPDLPGCCKQLFLRCHLPEVVYISAIAIDHILVQFDHT